MYIHLWTMYIHVYSPDCTYQVHTTGIMMYIHLEPQFPIYAWNMPGIYHVYVDLNYIHGIYIVCPWIYHAYPLDWIYMVYPWIFHVYPSSIYTVHPWIYMVYHWMYIHGIYVVYCAWIFLAFWDQISRQASATGLIQCTHACRWSRVFYSTRLHGNCARGKGCQQKAHDIFFPQPQSLSPLPPPLPALEEAAAAVEAALASFLAALFSRISCLVKVGADCAGPSGLVRSVTYSMRRFN